MPVEVVTFGVRFVCHLSYMSSVWNQCLDTDEGPSRRPTGAWKTVFEEWTHFYSIISKSIEKLYRWRDFV